MRLKKTIIGGMAYAFLAATSLTASFAMPGMEHSAAPNGGDGMEMSATSSGADIMLKNDLQNGVAARAHLQDIKAAMAQHGGTQTHHFMVEFYTEAEGKRLDGGSVAVKILDPEGNELKPLKMMAMEGSFGADVELNKIGTYQFEVGTKLSDGQKRVFRFPYNNANVAKSKGVPRGSDHGNQLK